MTVNWDQARSGTGPALFKATVSVNGGTSFTDLLDYTVPESGAPLGSWSSTVSRSRFSNSISLGGSASNKSRVIVRFVNREASASSGGGTNRIDNITVNGIVVPSGTSVFNNDCNDA